MRVLVLRHRRVLAAAALAAASGLAVDAAVASPPPGVPVLVAASDLPAGHVLSADDLTAVRVAAGAAAAHRVQDPVGRTLAAPLRAGEPVTDVRVVGSVAAGLSPGRVALPVRLGDDGALRWLRPGQRVAVLAVAGDPVGGGVDASRPADLVADDVVVLDVPADPAAGALAPGTPTAAVVLLDVTEGQARTIATSSAGGWLTVALMP